MRRTRHGESGNFGKALDPPLIAILNSLLASLYLVKCQQRGKSREDAGNSAASAGGCDSGTESCTTSASSSITENEEDVSIE